MAFLTDLDATRPSAFTLLGEQLVLWRDGQGEWQAYADRCPHRLAPLSEGRVTEEGMLECPYHGWAFGGPQGGCTIIPQDGSGGACSTMGTNVSTSVTCAASSMTSVS